MFVEAIETLLNDRCTPAAVRAIETCASPESLWRAIAEAGFLELLRPEGEDGAGLPLSELYVVVAGSGRARRPQLC